MCPTNEIERAVGDPARAVRTRDGEVVRCVVVTLPDGGDTAGARAIAVTAADYKPAHGGYPGEVKYAN